MTDREFEAVLQAEWGEQAKGGISKSQYGRGEGYGRVQAYCVVARREYGRYREVCVIHTSRSTAIRMALAAVRAEATVEGSEQAVGGNGQIPLEMHRGKGRTA